MKRIIILSVILFAALTFNAAAKKNYHGVGGYFYSQLSPYGTWIEVDYGVVVWRPTIIRVNWMPYQMGRWVYTYDGWYWDSYEPFGFITYHYGRWYYDDYYGWLWYPDYEWAPAWVEWRYDNSYIGWAPLHPYAVFSISSGIYYSNVYVTPYYHWNYVTYVNFCDPYVYNYYVAPGVKQRVYGKTKTRHNFVYYNGRVQNRGVDVKYVSVRSGKEIRQRDIVRVNDSRELRRDGYTTRDEIRTLDMSREQLERNDLGRMEIKRENRKTSIDIEKVKVGRRENVSIDVRKDVTRDRKPDGIKSEQKRTDVRNESRVSDQKRNGTVKNSNENRNKNDGKVNQNTSRVFSQNDNQVKQQQKSQSNESQNLNRNNENITKQVKKDNTSNNKEQNDRIQVKQQERSDVQKRSSNDSKQGDDRTKGNDKTKERKRR